MIIGVTGTDGSGKGAAVEHLVNRHGFTHYSARALITEAMHEAGLEGTRNDLRVTANRLRKEHGNDYLVTHYLRTYQSEGVKDAVIESIRTLAEAKTLQERGGILLAIDADPELRYQRITGRGSSSDKVTFEEFLAQEAVEMNDPDPNGMQKAAVMAAADHTIMNNGSFAELAASLDAVLATYEHTD